MYSHTKELRSRIESRGHLCRLSDSALCFSVLPFEDLITQGITEIRNFYRGGDLLTYLYRQLQVVDPAHCTLLKFLFLRSLEPYCGFIRSWIYEAKIIDPYSEFIVEYAAAPPFHLPDKDGTVDFQLATIREQDGAVIPCFLNDVLVPLLRAGQQLQVVMKLLRLCNYAHAGEDCFEDILPNLSDFPTHKVSGYPLRFNKREIEAIVLSRKEFYSKMHEKLENLMGTIDINYRQVILHDAVNIARHSSTLDETWGLPPAVAESNSDWVARSMDSEASSSMEDFSYALELDVSSEYSSTDDLDDQVDVAQPLDPQDSLPCSSQQNSFSLVFSSLSSDKASHKFNQVQETSCIQSLSPDIPGKTALNKDDASCKEPLDHSRSWLSDIQYGGVLPNLGWPVGGLHKNPFSIKHKFKDDINLISCVDIMEEDLSCSSNRSALEHITMCGAFNEPKISSSNRFLLQSWNAKYPTNVLSMNPMLTKNGFLKDLKRDSRKSGNTSNISTNFLCFDFSVVTNPLKVFEGHISAIQRYYVGNNVISSANYGSSTVARVDGCDMPINVADIQLDKDQFGVSLSLKNNETGHLKNPRGGSSWQDWR